MIHDLIPRRPCHDINGCLETHRESCVITWLRITSMWTLNRAKRCGTLHAANSRYGDASNGKKRVRVSWTNGVAWPGIRRLALWQRGLEDARYESANVMVAAMCSGG